MKKYIKPSVEIINVETQSILAGSDTIYKNSDPNSTVGSSSVLAPGRRNRNNDIWDDDEDWD